MVNVARDSVAVFEALLSKGLAVRAGVEFGMPSWLRITIGRPEENRLLIEELQGILKSSEG